MEQSAKNVSASSMLQEDALEDDPFESWKDFQIFCMFVSISQKYFHLTQKCEIIQIIFVVTDS